MQINIIGIDPAIANTGLALAKFDLDTNQFEVADLRLIKTAPGRDGKVVRKSSDDLLRARTIVDGISEWVRAHRPAFAIAEVPTGTQSARGSFSNGVCCGVLAALPLPLIEVSPTEVKLASVGHKHAAKEEIIEWATEKWPHASWLTKKQKGVVSLVADNEHLADACAAIAAGIKTAQFAQAIALMRASMKVAA